MPVWRNSYSRLAGKHCGEMTKQEASPIEVRPTTRLRFSTRRRVLCRTVLWVCVLPLGVYCYAQIGFGSLRNMSAYLRGDLVLAEFNILDLGRVEPGKDYTAAFIVRNVSAGSVNVLGARTCCGCSLLSHLPLTVEPNEQVEVVFLFQVAASQPTGPVKREILLLLDKGGGHGPILAIEAEVVDLTEFSSGVAATTAYAQGFLVAPTLFVSVPFSLTKESCHANFGTSCDGRGLSKPSVGSGRVRPPRREVARRGATVALHGHIQLRHVPL
jgi:hypothetical protein